MPKKERIINLSDLTLLPGDVLLTRHASVLGFLINAVQGLRSPDGKAKTRHVEFVVNPDGVTFAARWVVKEYHISDYIGKEIVIVRNQCMTQETFARHYRTVKAKHNGKMYPAYRMLFHLSTAVSRLTPFGNGVCSEVVGYLLYLCEMVKYYKGMTPDNLDDIVCDPWAGSWETIACGKLGG